MTITIKSMLATGSNSVAIAIKDALGQFDAERAALADAQALARSWQARRLARETAETVRVVRARAGR